jgi:hypothetical protein
MRGESELKCNKSPQKKSVPNYFVNLTLIYCCNFQLFELRNIFEEIIKILFCILGSFIRVYL